MFSCIMLKFHTLEEEQTKYTIVVSFSRNFNFVKCRHQIMSVFDWYATFLNRLETLFFDKSF